MGPVFTRFNDTSCNNRQYAFRWAELFDDYELTDRPTGDFCRDYCLQTNCDTFTEYLEDHGEVMGELIGCAFEVFDPDIFRAVPDAEFVNCFVRGEVPPSVDCSSTSNCTPQLSACGGSIPDRNFAKADLLSCISNASHFNFDSKTFVRKTRRKTGNDFFYNKVDKTFMNG